MTPITAALEVPAPADFLVEVIDVLGDVKRARPLDLAGIRTGLDLMRDYLAGVSRATVEPEQRAHTAYIASVHGALGVLLDALDLGDVAAAQDALVAAFNGPLEEHGS